MAGPKQIFASRDALLCLLGLGLAVQLGVASAQETIQKAPVSDEVKPALSQLDEPLAGTLEASVEEWRQVKNEISASEVSDILKTAGWKAGLAAADYGAIAPEDRFSIFSRNVAEGVSDFLVVSETSEQMPPLEFKSAASSGIVQANWLPWSEGMPSAEEIRDEIIAGMQAAIDSLCKMRARPSEIKAKASAAGIVEIEATWVSADVCN